MELRLAGRFPAHLSERFLSLNFCVADTYLQEAQVLNLTGPFPPQTLENTERPCLFGIWSRASWAADIY